VQPAASGLPFARDSPARAGARLGMLVLTPIGKMSYWISRIAPAFYECMMMRQLKSELRAK